MTQEAAKSGRGKTLKRVAALLCIAVAGWFAYAYTTKYLAERPRFNEAAWTDANAVLVEATGKDAVERGVVTIPKAKIAVPRKSFALTGLQPSALLSCEIGYGESIWAILDGPRSFLVRKSASCHIADPVAIVTQQEARHVISVLYYLERLQAPGIMGRASYNEQCMNRQLSLNDDHFDDPNSPLTSDGKKLDRGLITSQLTGHLALSYALGLFRRGEAHITDDADAVRALGKALLEHNLPPHNIREALLANEAIGFLTTYPDPSALAPLERALRLAQRGWSRPGWKQTPLVRQFFPGEEYPGYLGPADAAIWAAKTLGDKPENKRAQIAFDAREANAKNRFGPSLYLATAYPSDYAKLLAAKYPSYDAKTRLDALRNYYRAWGSDVRVAQAGAEDADVQARFLANLQLFKLTKDRKALSACLTCLNELYDAAKSNQYILQRYYGSLAQAYFDDPTLSEIPPAFRSVIDGVGDEQALAEYLQAAPGTLERIFAVLVLAGGKEDVDAAMKIASAYEISDLVSPQGGYFRILQDYSTGFATMRALHDAKDPQAADRIVEFLAARSPALSSGICEALLTGLAERGDRRLLPILDAALAEQGRAPVYRKCIDRDKGRPDLDFTDFLRRARMTVEMRNAADPTAYLSDTKARDPQLLQEATARFLEERYTTSQLQALLADERRAGFRSAICLAIMHQRERDVLAQWQ